MDTRQISDLLEPYIVGLSLKPELFEQLNVYLDLLLRWNAKTNLTAIRDPEQIVTRHFGESLFTAKVLTDLLRGAPRKLGLSGIQDSRPDEVSAPPDAPFSDNRQLPTDNCRLADLGSGAGFPGLPIKLAIPDLHVTLIESQNKKATFLKEVSRALKLEGIEVYNGRAEQWGKQADVVTMRAVEKFESVLPTALKLLKPNGRLCLLIGAGQLPALTKTAVLSIQVATSLPLSADSKVIVGVVAGNSSVELPM